MKTRYKKWLLFVNVALLMVCGASAQQLAYESPAGTKFLLYTPPGYSSSTSTYPLLLSLHSKGEVGDDLQELTSKNPEQMPCRLIYLNKWPLDLPFIVLTPQLKPDPNDPERQWPVEYIDEVVKHVLQHYRVDLNRIYVTGISRGATGSWKYAAAYPDKVAALLPLSGRTDTTEACLIKNIPTWAFHGDGDTVAPPEYSINMFNAINHCAPVGLYKPRLTLIQAHAHNGWNEVYNGSSGYRVYEWLLQFKKNDVTNKKPYVSAGRDLKVHLRTQPLHLYGDYFDWDGSIVDVTWKQISGPTLTLDGTHNNMLKISDLQKGTCEFQLTVIDNHGAVSVDKVLLEITDTTVSPAVTGLVLVDGKSNIEIGDLSEGQVINKTALGLTEINIRATVTDGTGSVLFSINSDQSSRTVNSPGPYYLKNPTTSPEWKIKPGDYSICATAFAQPYGRGTPGISKCFKISITDGVAPTCPGTGTIQREVWTGISGNLVSNIPLNTTPTSVNTLNIFEAPYNVADNYGTRIRGYVCAPVTGTYYFWVSSDDHSELWLSTDENAINKKKIAYVSGATLRREWTKYPSQKSVGINLVSGKKYYIEVLHKEGTANDHVAVGWQLPNGTLERPLPGTRLIPFNTSVNTPPVVNVTSPSSGSNFTAPASVTISATATDTDGVVNKVEFYNGSNKLGEDLTSPYSYTWSNVATGNYTIIAKATDNQGASSTSSVNISVTATTSCTATGTILREAWTNITGKLVSYIPLNSPPTNSSYLTIFEGPSNAGENYGSRIAGFICPPVSGNYVFWISSDDHSELWLSTNIQPANKVKIAYLTGATGRRQWNAVTTQQSAPINLVAGNTYYIEALHKEGTAYDHIAVGWQLPNGVLERPIPGNRLSPAPAQSIVARTSVNESLVVEDESTNHIFISPNPVERGASLITISGLPRNLENAFMIYIVDMTGHVLYSEKRTCVSCNENISISPDLPQGVYLVKVSTNGKVFSAQLVIK